MDEGMRVFFRGNAFVAFVVLGLIVVFLFREGHEFFGQYRESLVVYRQAGLEFVDVLKREERGFAALGRQWDALRVETGARGGGTEKLAAMDAFSDGLYEAFAPVRGLIAELGETAMERKAILLAGTGDGGDWKVFSARVPQVRTLNEGMRSELEKLVKKMPEVPRELEGKLTEFRAGVGTFLGGMRAVEGELGAWDGGRRVGWWEAWTGFVFGREWLTASFWQDWYGLLPLLCGSVLVSCVALLIAVPLAVGSAVYVNRFAGERERTVIKPVIEFFGAVPSVVLGFFGIAVLGTILRDVSQWECLAWVPGFPFAERLNALTAGCLLGFIAIPIVFTLVEDALDGVPGALSEASLALGASRLQTVLRVVIPAAFPGIVSAVLLGFGRVVGETMVVLLCAGNRIAIPDFTAGVGVVGQPVHTLTGIVAQEMGEVVRGSMHYRALFVVGLVLFFLSLLINCAAVRLARRMSQGVAGR